MYLAGMLLRTLSAGFIAPCLPSKTDKPPSGRQWLHEIKHDGFRVITRKNGAQVRLYSRPGNDLTNRFPLIVETLARLRSRSCIIDGEAVGCDHNGVASFDRVCYRHHDESILAKAGPGIRFNEHMDGDGETVFRHACKLGLEGIVSKRKDCLSFRPLARLAQDEKCRCPGSEARGRGGLGKGSVAMSVAPESSRNRIA
jgi:bifunctional non-homologous end joining protein LigD